MIANPPKVDMTRINTPLEAMLTPLADVGVACALDDAPTGILDLYIQGEMEVEGEVQKVRIGGWINKPTRPFSHLQDSQDLIVGRLSGALGGLPVDITFYFEGLTVSHKGEIGENQVDLAMEPRFWSLAYQTEGRLGEVETDLWAKTRGRRNSVEGTLNGQEVSGQSVRVEDGRWELSGQIGEHRLTGTVVKETPSLYLLEETIGPVTVRETIELWPRSTEPGLDPKAHDRTRENGSQEG